MGKENYSGKKLKQNYIKFRKYKVLCGMQGLFFLLTLLVFPCVILLSRITCCTCGCCLTLSCILFATSYTKVDLLLVKILLFFIFLRHFFWWGFLFMFTINK